MLKSITFAIAFFVTGSAVFAQEDTPQRLTDYIKVCEDGDGACMPKGPQFPDPNLYQNNPDPAGYCGEAPAAYWSTEGTFREAGKPDVEDQKYIVYAIEDRLPDNRPSYRVCMTTSVGHTYVSAFRGSGDEKVRLRALGCVDIHHAIHISVEPVSHYNLVSGFYCELK
ncbi:hypothetical protein [uncultured Roseibium sp.]|uniref:hypothetical protein n=1 Tax=uncultured Roseibium sp. TaxID=1936171 RepID=UPI002616A0C9|nr:hypothetical protein [uncultured Roseibium sp.]